MAWLLAFFFRICELVATRICDGWLFEQARVVSTGGYVLFPSAGRTGRVRLFFDTPTANSTRLATLTWRSHPKYICYAGPYLKSFQRYERREEETLAPKLTAEVVPIYIHTTFLPSSYISEERAMGYRGRITTLAFLLATRLSPLRRYLHFALALLAAPSSPLSCLLSFLSL